MRNGSVPVSFFVEIGPIPGNECRTSGFKHFTVLGFVVGRCKQREDEIPLTQPFAGLWYRGSFFEATASTYVTGRWVSNQRKRRKPASCAEEKNSGPTTKKNGGWWDGESNEAKLFFF